MVGKNQLKLVKSLHQKKYRNEHGLFFVEGYKSVLALLQSTLQPYLILCTEDMIHKMPADNDIVVISKRDLEKISAHKNSSGVLAVFINQSNLL